MLGKSARLTFLKPPLAGVFFFLHGELMKKLITAALFAATTVTANAAGIFPVDVVRIQNLSTGQLVRCEGVKVFVSKSATSSVYITGECKVIVPAYTDDDNELCDPDGYCVPLDNTPPACNPNGTNAGPGICY